MNIEEVLRQVIKRGEHNSRIHRIGHELRNPVDPLASVVAGKIGTAEGPARSDHQHPLQADILAFHGSGAVSGAPDLKNQHTKIYGNLVIAYVTAVGGFIINFPGGGFPNGLLNVSPVLGDNTGATSLVCLNGGSDKTKFKIILFTGAGESGTGNYRVWYEATGW